MGGAIVFTTMNHLPALTKFRWIVVNSSAGKDSQTALRVVVQECDRQGVSRDRIVVSHQCLGESEWQGTKELAQAQASFYGLRFEVTSYRNKAGQSKSLLEYVAARGKWPSSTARYCTSDFKRSPGGRVVTQLRREAAGDILNVYGFRSEESPARAAKKVFVRNERLSTRDYDVIDWLPIHAWTEKAVWASIKASGVPYHQAYDLGMPRLSCAFCIFAPRHALLIAGKHNPALLDKYIAVEDAIGHTFQNGASLREIRNALVHGEQPAAVSSGAWNM